jgi:protein-tyrosine phosphatase
MDDGAASVAEALALLRILKADGVDTVVATPHLYLHRQSVRSFFADRGRSSRMLSEAIDAEAERGITYPNIVLGAEIYFQQGVGSLPLEKLCIGDTNYFMLELPYTPLSTTVMNSFANFLNFCDGGIKIILAHIERYYDFNPDRSRVNEVLSYGLISQGNCDSVIAARSRRVTLDLIRKGDIKLLGTDLHNVHERPPRFGEAERIIRRKVSDDAFLNMMQTAERILAGQ